jgi:hypothetical protein
MVTRLRTLCPVLGLLSTGKGCAALPPLAPLRATLAPAAPAAIAPPVPPPVDVPPAVIPPPDIPPPYSAGGRRPDTDQLSPYEGAIDYERKMDEEERDYWQWRRAGTDPGQRHQQW